jgi:prephenate dehydrogenase
VIQSVAIVGVGLIGGSFALALRRAGFRGELLGVSSPASLQAALARGVIDEGLPLEEACVRADLILLAQPILQIIAALERLAGRIRPGALVTDVGSTKQEIVAAAVRHGIPFVGGHPMAGKETRGVGSADAALFEGRPWILTPTGDDPPSNELQRWILRIGARLRILTPDEHDHLVALSSHLPQLLSTALAGSLDATRAGETAGPGLHDMTRLALSSADLWRDILATNREPVAAALHLYLERLTQLRQALLAGADLDEEFTRGRRFAERIRGDSAC